MEKNTDVFANRDEPIPVLPVTHSDGEDAPTSATKPGKRERLKQTLSGLKDAAQDQGAGHVPQLQGNLSLQDRLFTKLLQQVIPPEDVDESGDSPVDRRSSRYVQRPAFSLPLMTNNFRRFNARIGIVFVFQNRLIRLFTWVNPMHTLSFLSVYTFVCLDPYLLVVLPLAVILLFIMIPAFIARHPPPPPSTITSATTPYYSYTGPALAPAPTVKPASETSKDFFRNMRDLQNSMADFANMHDTTVKLVAPPTNFSNEILSTTLYLYLSLLTCSLFIIAHLIPWRAIFLLVGYAAVICGHPTVQEWLIRQQKKAETQVKEADSQSTHPSNSRATLFGISLPTPKALQSLIFNFSAITLDSAPEVREVEIFELQHRGLNSQAAEWEPWVFTPQPYDPLSPSRISGDRPHGTRFFEDVQPPSGWAWDGPKWELDLEPREWVAERLVTGVEFDLTGVDNDDDVASISQVGRQFGGWVWDLPPAVKSPGTEDDERWLAYGDDVGDVGKRLDKKQKAKHEAKISRDWEEGRWAGKTGEWRRRRWVRVVKRVGLGIEGGSPANK